METPIEAGSLDRGVMPAVYIYAPPASHRFVLAKTCPDCGKRTRMLGWSYEWHGASLTCLRCGREWQGGAGDHIIHRTQQAAVSLSRTQHSLGFLEAGRKRDRRRRSL